jgi:hypothetical protein
MLLYISGDRYPNNELDSELENKSAIEFWRRKSPQS